jgi:hypothetical protein
MDVRLFWIWRGFRRYGSRCSKVKPRMKNQGLVERKCLKKSRPRLDLCTSSMHPHTGSNRLRRNRFQEIQTFKNRTRPELCVIDDRCWVWWSQTFSDLETFKNLLGVPLPILEWRFQRPKIRIWMDSFVVHNGKGQRGREAIHQRKPDFNLELFLNLTRSYYTANPEDRDSETFAKVQKEKMLLWIADLNLFVRFQP